MTSKTSTARKIRIRISSIQEVKYGDGSIRKIGTKTTSAQNIPIMNRIKTKVSSVWKVKYGDGSMQLLVLNTGFVTEEVVRFVKVHHPHTPFVVSAVDVGVFNLRKTIPIENSYQTDGRSMNQDEEIVEDNIMPYITIRDHFGFIDTISEQDNAILLDKLLSKKRKQKNGKTNSMSRSTNAIGHKGRQSKIIRRFSQTRRN